MPKCCICSAGCKAIVKTAGKVYAKGHNPAFWNRERKVPQAKEMTAEQYAAWQVSMRNKHGAYATEKKFSKCPHCSYVDGVRGLRRHKATCPGKVK